MGSGDLHALVAGFEGGAASYDRGRPAYNPAVIDAIVEALDVDAGARVLDLAAGTGLLSRPLLARGLDVVAVEPLGAMREVLARAIGAERARDGRAEAIPLPDGHIDAVVCGDAFHWFDGDRAAAELHRVLRPGAGLCVAFIAPGWREDAPAWLSEAGALLEPLRREARHPHLAEVERCAALERHGGFAPLDRREVRFADETDRDGVLAYFASISFVGALPARERETLLGRLTAVLDRHEVTAVRRPFVAELWFTRKA
jgi:SAM-dependent methyltransferase